MSALADILEIWGFEQGKVIFSDGSLGFGLTLTPIDVATWEDSRIDKLAEGIGTFLNGLPSGIDLQFVQDIMPAGEKLIHDSEKLAHHSVESTARTLHNLRLETLKDDIKAGNLPAQTLRLFVRKPLPTGTFKKPKFLSRSKAFVPMPEETLYRELTALSHLEAEVTASLKALSIRVTPMTEREIADVIYQQWNPLRAEKLQRYDADDVRPALLFSDISVYEKGFSIGGMHHRIVSLKLMPDSTFASMARVLKDLPFGSRLLLSIHVPDQQKELENLQSQRRLAFSMARGKKEGVSDIESEAKLQDLETLIAEMVAQGEKVFQVSLGVILKSEDQEVLTTLVSDTISSIRALSGAEAMEESIATFEIFKEAALPNARSRERARRIKTSNLADLIPFFGSWLGFEKPRIFLKTRNQELFSMDPFASELSNYNQVVAGGSGSGKSFLTNILLLQTLKESPRVFIVDIGGSYKKLCDNLAGQYIPFSLSDSFSLNPFDLLPGEAAPSSQKIKFLLGLTEMMTQEVGETGIKRLERSEIEEAIQEVYDRISKPQMSDLQALLLSRSSQTLQRFGKILSTWCGDSPYGQMIDKPTTISLEKPIVCFDLKGLEPYPDLQAVCLYLITDFVWREVQRDRSTMKFLVFDECWKLLESSSGSAFIGEVFRTFRKYYASAIAISQNIDDFAKSKVSQAILSNTSIKWILMQKGADYERLKEVLHLNDTEISIISSLHQKRGEYSEAFLMAEDNRCPVRIAPTALEYWIATTDPRDLALLQNEDAKGTGTLDLLKSLAERFPQGVVAGEGSGKE